MKLTLSSGQFFVKSTLVPGEVRVETTSTFVEFTLGKDHLFRIGKQELDAVMRAIESGLV